MTFLSKPTDPGEYVELYLRVRVIDRDRLIQRARERYIACWDNEPEWGEPPSVSEAALELIALSNENSGSPVDDGYEFQTYEHEEVVVGEKEKNEGE